MADDKPRFDYSNYSRAQEKRIHQLQLRLQRMAYQFDERSIDMSDADFESRVAEFESMGDEIEGLLLAQVVYVPREWFVDDAPKDISCDTPQWWGWMRADKLRVLKAAAEDAKSPEAVSGN